MSLSQYLLGALELAVIAASLGLGAFHVRSLIVPGWRGAPARLAELVLGISALIVISELVGVVGLFKEGFLVGACALVGIGGGYWARNRAQPRTPDAPPPPMSRAMFWVAVAASALVVVHWSIPTQESFATGMYYQDTTWYHMSFSARFVQDATVGPLHFTDPTALTPWFYPQNAELLHAVPILLFGSDFFSPLVNLCWLLVALLAAWCVGRPFALGAVTLLGAAVVLDSHMILGSQAGNAPNDIVGLFALLATLAFLITGASTGGARRIAGASGAPEAPTEPPAGGVAVPVPRDEPDDRPLWKRFVTGAGEADATDSRLAGVGVGPLFLAGLAAGIGVGTKITLLAALGVLTLGVIFLGGRSGWLRAGVVWLGGMLITAGFWYGRSLVFAGNPFPQVGSLAGVNLPGPDQGTHLIYPRDPHKLSEYYNDPTVWKSWLVPVLDNRLGPLWFVILGIVVVALVVALFRGGSWLMKVLAVTGIVAGIAYVFTPLTASGGLGHPSGFEANLRYVSPVLIIGLVLLPLVPALRRGRWPWILVGVYAVLLIQGTLISPRWDLGHYFGAGLLGLILVGVPVALMFMSRQRVPVAAMVALPVAAFVLLVALGRPVETDYLRDRYAASSPLRGGFRAGEEWTPLERWGKSVTDSRIAVVGRAAAFGQYAFYGDDLSNYVQYIGNELNLGTFRPIDEDCKVFRKVVNAGDYDYVVTTPRFEKSSAKEPKENRWVEGPDSETVIVSGPARVYRLTGELNAGACGRLGELEPRQ